MQLQKLLIASLIGISTLFSNELQPLLPTLDQVIFKETIDGTGRITIDAYHDHDAENTIGFIYYDLIEKYIYSLHVNREHRGNAIGTNLFLMALRDLERHQVDRVSWGIIPNSDSFYKKFGAYFCDNNTMEFIFKKCGDPLKNFKRSKPKPVHKKNCIIL